MIDDTRQMLCYRYDAADAVVEGQSQDDPMKDIASLTETTAQLICCRECRNVIGTPTVCTNTNRASDACLVTTQSRYCLQTRTLSLTLVQTSTPGSDSITWYNQCSHKICTYISLHSSTWCIVTTACPRVFPTEGPLVTAHRATLLTVETNTQSGVLCS